MKTYTNLNILKNIKSVCLISHIEPDPDAIASMVVFKEFLMDTFNITKVDIFAESSNLSDNLNYILGNNKLNPKPSEYDIAIMLDSPNSKRLGEYEYLFVDADTKIVIDHHATNAYAGDINIVELCSSTCEIIHSILTCYKYNLSKNQKGKLYSGIITDTNNFTVGETSSRTFTAVADLIEDIDRNKIYKTYLGNLSLKNLQLQACAIKNIKSFHNNSIIITHIKPNEMTKLNATYNDLQGIANHLATIKTADLICFIEPKDNHYYVSMRAKDGFDVSVTAKENGGGGHIGAAAFETNKSIKSIENIVLSSFEKQLKPNKPNNRNPF